MCSARTATTEDRPPGMYSCRSCAASMDAGAGEAPSKRQRTLPPRHSAPCQLSAAHVPKGQGLLPAPFHTESENKMWGFLHVSSW